MYRPSRIVAEKLQQYVIKNEEMIRDNEYGASEERLNAYWIALSFCELQEGDILSGLEILAGMPREEQQKWLDWGCPSDLGIGTTKTDNDYCFKFREVISDMGDRRENCEKCKLHTLSQQYIYRNGTFEVYEGEK